MKNITTNKLILFTSIYMTLFYNYTFFKNIIKVYGFENYNILYIASTALVLFALIVFLFSIVSSRFTTKPLLILVLFISSFASYFMDTYNTIIDSEMIRNVVQTNINESMDLISMKLVLYILLLGVLPSIFIYKTKIEYGTFKQELFSKLKILSLSLIIIVIMLLSFSRFYSSFLGNINL